MSDSEFELRRLVTIATFTTPWEAQIAQARLGADGIHSLIAGEHLIRMVALSNALGGIQLQVRDEDAAAAAAALQGMAPLPEIRLVGQAGGMPEGDGDDNDEDEDGENETDDGIERLAGDDQVPTPGSPPGKEPTSATRRDRCPSCGGDLQLERSSRLMMGVLPVSSRAYRCGSCGVLWKPDEIGGDTDAAAERPQVSGGMAAPGEGNTGEEASAATAPLATVARFHTPWEAHLARTFLESEGLRANVVEELLPAVNLLASVAVPRNRLEVQQSDAGRASAILARAASFPTRVAAAEPEDDPEES